MYAREASTGGWSDPAARPCTAADSFASSTTTTAVVGRAAGQHLQDLPRVEAPAAAGRIDAGREVDGQSRLGRLHLGGLVIDRHVHRRGRPRPELGGELVDGRRPRQPADRGPGDLRVLGQLVPRHQVADQVDRPSEKNERPDDRMATGTGLRRRRTGSGVRVAPIGTALRVETVRSGAPDSRRSGRPSARAVRAAFRAGDSARIRVSRAARPGVATGLSLQASLGGGRFGPIGPLIVRQRTLLSCLVGRARPARPGELVRRRWCGRHRRSARTSCTPSRRSRPRSAAHR